MPDAYLGVTMNLKTSSSRGAQLCCDLRLPLIKSVAYVRGSWKGAQLCYDLRLPKNLVIARSVATWQSPLPRVHVGPYVKPARMATSSRLAASIRRRGVHVLAASWNLHFTVHCFRPVQVRVNALAWRGVYMFSYQAMACLVAAQSLACWRNLAFSRTTNS
jgi:hypothetical protein